MLAFVHIPKSGGGSVKWWIKNYKLPILHQGHCNLLELKESSPEEITQSFCIVRNTYARIISVYNFAEYKARKRLVNKKTQFYKPAIEVLEKHSKGIEYFVQWMIERNHVNVVSQLDWINGVDLILQQENLKSDFVQIQQKLNCYHILPESIHKLNYNPQLFYTKSYINFINRIYEKEIEYFNYTPQYKIL